MSEVLGGDYTSLVRQVYINPIRSVVVVDDDFPTLDGLLSSAKEDIPIAQVAIPLSKSPTVGADEGPSGGANDAAPAQAQATASRQGARNSHVSMRFDGKKAEVDRIRALISACRKRERPWLVDVHDGQPGSGPDELVLAPSLHHSDLMILDYHLTGDAGSGDRAIEILRKLAGNHHFNLVIVYTKGVNGDIQRVFEEIAIGLTHRNGITVHKERIQAVGALIAEWEEEVDDFGLAKNLEESVSTLSYLKERGEKGCLVKSEIGEHLKSVFNGCPTVLKRKKVEINVDGQPESVLLHPGTIIEWAIAQRHERHDKAMSELNLGTVQCALDGDLNWIRTDKIFVTVVKKDNAPEELENKLVSALNAWAPGPHQLLMGKMRAQLGEKGGIAEAEVLRDRHLQAGWLREMLDAEGDSDRVLHNSISRHWEALGDRMHSDIASFAKNLFDNFRAADRASIERKYIATDIKVDDELAHLNHYYSTKPVDRSHLTTGQVLRIWPNGSNEDTPEYWICLSPACDLVPGQKSAGWRGRLGDSVPFMAVQLGETSLNTALSRINENRFLFVRTGEAVSAFTFVADHKSTSMPVWEQMFASQGGRFLTGRCAVPITRTFDVDGQLSVVSSEADVVCQLRSEYALNLLQRLGGALSRVGLDFRSPTEKKGTKKSESVAVIEAPAAPQKARNASPSDESVVADGESGK